MDLDYNRAIWCLSKSLQLIVMAATTRISYATLDAEIEKYDEDEKHIINAAKFLSYEVVCRLEKEGFTEDYGITLTFNKKN